MKGKGSFHKADERMCATFALGARELDMLVLLITPQTSIANQEEPLYNFAGTRLSVLCTAQGRV